MKKLMAAAFFTVLISCNNESDADTTTSDTTGQKNPDGMVNSNRISTDTGAYRVDETGDSSKAHKLADSALNK